MALDPRELWRLGEFGARLAASTSDASALHKRPTGRADTRSDRQRRPGHPLEPAEPLPNRRVIAIAAFLLQTALGVSQIWSVFRDPLATLSGWTVSEVTLAYSLNLFISGIASCLGGIVMRRVGSRTLALAAGVLFGLGLCLASLAEGRLWLLYVAYGLVAGIGRGVGAVVAPSMLVRWFPEKRGLMSGLAGAGIGIGTLLCAPIAGLLVETAGVLATLSAFGIATLLVIVGVGSVLRDPPLGYRPPGWTPPDGSAARRSVSLRTSLRTRACYGLWFLLLLNSLAGLAVLSQAAPLAQALTGAGLHQAASLLGVIALAAVIGQVSWGWLADWAGRRQAFAAMLLLQSVALVLLTHATTYMGFLAATSLIMACLGGGLATIPALAADYFGTRDLGAILGFLFTAMGASALLAPLALALVHEGTGEYTLALNLLALVAALGMALPLALRPPSSTRRRRTRLVPVRAPRPVG